MSNSRGLCSILTACAIVACVACAQEPANVATIKWNGGRISALAFSSDGTMLAVGGSTFGDPVQLWDVATRKEKMKLRARLAGTSHCIAFSPDNRLVASGSSAPEPIHIWEVASGQLRTKITKSSKKEELSSEVVTFTPDGKYFVSGEGDGIVIVWDASTMQERLSFVAHNERLTAMAFSRDGKLLATASADKSVIVWNAETFKQKAKLLGHKDQIWCIAWSNDGKLLASGSKDGSVIVWDPLQGKAIATLTTGDSYYVDSVAFSADDALLASSGTDHVVRLWDVATGKVQATLQGQTVEFRARVVRFSPDGKLLADWVR